MATDEEDGREGARVVGEVHTLTGTRRGTLDQGDGGATLAFDVAAATIPREYATSPVDSIWRVTLSEIGSNPVSFNAARMTTRAGRRGKAQIRLAVLASDLPLERLYGCRDAEALIEMGLTTGSVERSKALDRGERMRIMRNCFVHCREPEFLAFLEKRARASGFPVQSPDGRPAGEDGDDRPTIEDRTSQHVYLLARIHSRQEILESAEAAIAVDEILRAYRIDIWNRKADGPRRTDAGVR